jgi:hypothetical protein
MKVNQSLLSLSIIIFTLSACSAFTVSNRSGTITVDTQPKQPNVIVNEKVNGKVKERDKT